MAEKVQRRTDPRTVKIEFSEAVLLAVSLVPSGRLDHADESGEKPAQSSSCLGTIYPRKLAR